MKTQDRPRGNAVFVTVLVVLGLLGVGLYAAVGDVQWGVHSTDQQPGTDSGVVPTAFLQPAATSPAPPEKRGQLSLARKDAPGTPLPVGRLLSLNGDDFRHGFVLSFRGFQAGDVGGTVTVFSGGVPLTEGVAIPAGQAVNDTTIELTLREAIDQGKREIHAIWSPPNVNKTLMTKPLSVRIDTVGPILRTARLVGDPEKKPLILVEFVPDDDDPTTIRDFAEAALVTDNFILEKADEQGRFTSASATLLEPVAEGNVVRLEFEDGTKLGPGVYRITVRGEKKPTDDNTPPATPFRDAVGNYAGGSGSQGAEQTRTFAIQPRPEESKLVEFAEFQPTLPQPDFARRFNPADKVVTEVVRLYYYRDAHRVAQLINRTAKSLNRAAVEQARRRAQDARTRADELTDERRAKEREAVRLAEELRRMERELAAAQEQGDAAAQDKTRIDPQLTSVQQEIAELESQNVENRLNTVNNRLRAIDSELRTLSRNIEQIEANIASTTDDLQKATATIARLKSAVEAGTASEDEKALYRKSVADEGRLQAELDALLSQRADKRLAESNLLNEQRQKTEERRQLQPLVDQLQSLRQREATLNGTLSDIATFSAGQRNKVANLDATLADLRQRAAAANEASLQAQAKEDRAREEQFRLEVAAAHEDPDTVAFAKLDSVDPVAQVTVQVIGEGLIQLRGPQKGIDRIKTAINQIDAPVGQVKVEVVTVQLNGERGERMEKPLGRVEAQLGMGRFLTSQSLMLLRQSVQEVATQIAMNADQGGHYQVDRDRKYLYDFFGRDFVDELYEMDSEFLNTENKLLSLHSMDTVSLHEALFIVALAKNDVRQQILETFMGKVRSDLVQAEFDYRRSAELCPFTTHRIYPLSQKPEHLCHWQQWIVNNNCQRYHFRNLLTFFDSLNCAPGDTMNPMQREFIRLAQIFKARLITELELKQRIVERALIEDDRERNLAEEEQAENAIRPQVLELTRDLRALEFKASDDFVKALDAVKTMGAEVRVRTDIAAEFYRIELEIGALIRSSEERSPTRLRELAEKASNLIEAINAQAAITETSREKYDTAQKLMRGTMRSLDKKLEGTALRNLTGAIEKAGDAAREAYESETKRADAIHEVAGEFARAADVRRFDWNATVLAYRRLVEAAESLPEPNRTKILSAAKTAYQRGQDLHLAKVRHSNAQFFLQQTRSSLDRKKLLDFLIEEQEHKYIDLLEGTRAHIATMDNYLKRLSIALEDDFKVQYYDPAFVRIRAAARESDVTLGAVERTTVLTNNRAFAKVEPQATMEFDLPKRKIAMVEALEGAKALVEDYGALLNDPTFLAAFQMMGGKPSNGLVQQPYPGLPSSTDEQQMGFGQQPKGQPGSALQSLVPDPSVYKFETGTGFEIRPVIQPDGNSIVYDFTYMYTTNVREPVRADEKHLGRIKRHFINTQVQTSSFELREVSRYQVALKAARTARGVPLFEDIPIAGAIFRPAPSAESSIQQNIILASSVVYPTLFDLMGLRWAPSVVDLNHISVRDAEHVVRGRRWSIENSVFDQSSRYVDDLLGIEYDTPKQYRPDLYHREWEPSPYHPGGYTYPDRRPDDDPTGEGYERPDRRPIETREPPYDRRFRRPVRYESVPEVAPMPPHVMPEAVVPSEKPLPALTAPDGASSPEPDSNKSSSSPLHQP